MARQSSKVTKRRKVWVQYFDGANKLLFGPRRVSDYKRPGFVPFLERLPSDAVLSRDDAKRIGELLKQNSEAAAKTRNAEAAVVAGGVEAAVLALLRGRR